MGEAPRAAIGGHERWARTHQARADEVRAKLEFAEDVGMAGVARAHREALLHHLYEVWRHRTQADGIRAWHGIRHRRTP